MVLRGDAAAETISVLLTEPLLTVPYLRHQTCFHSGQLGRRVRISQTTWPSTFLEGEQTWCIFHPTEIPWSTSHRTKLPSGDMASSGLRRLAQHLVQAK